MNYEDKELPILALIIFVLSIALVVLMLQGCTTTSHEPECKCKCTEVDATFECGGIHYSQELEMK